MMQNDNAVVTMPTSSELAPYLQEQRAEESWAHCLRHANISDGMDTPEDVRRMSANWRHFAGSLDLCSAGLMSVYKIAQGFQEYLEAKSKKGASAISVHDILVFVADKIWEAKLSNDAILNPALKLQAQFWQCDRTYRGRLHEAFVKSGKLMISEIQTLMAIAGIELSKDDMDRYLKEFSERQQAVLDDLLNNRQADAKRLVAQEIGKVLSIHQLPEAK